MKKNFKNNNWFTCNYCGYKNSEDELRDKLYVTDMKNGMIAVECPKCGVEQLKV